MIFAPQSLVYVYYQRFGIKQLVGRLLLKNREFFLNMMREIY